jgi:hypothetical protein
MVRQLSDRRNSKKRQWIVCAEWRSTALRDGGGPGAAAHKARRGPVQCGYTLGHPVPTVPAVTVRGCG